MPKAANLKSPGGQKALGFGFAVAVVCVGWVAVVYWLPTDEEFVAWLTAELDERLSIKVSIGSAHWALLNR